jgi:hypothetical protein
MTLSRRDRETAHGGVAVVLAQSGEGSALNDIASLPLILSRQGRSLRSRALKPSPAGRGLVKSDLKS